MTKSKLKSAIREYFRDIVGSRIPTDKEFSEISKLSEYVDEDTKEDKIYELLEQLKEKFPELEDVVGGESFSFDIVEDSTIDTITSDIMDLVTNDSEPSEPSEDDVIEEEKSKKDSEDDSDEEDSEEDDEDSEDNEDSEEEDDSEDDADSEEDDEDDDSEEDDEDSDSDSEDEDDDEDDDEDLKLLKRKLKLKNEEIEKLFSQDNNLSEEFNQKAKFLFETALNKRVNDEVKVLKEEMEKTYAVNLREAIEAHAEQLHEDFEKLTDRMDNYLDYVVEEWVKENKLAIESGIRNELTEDFIGGLKTLFKEHYVEIPEEKENLFESLEQKVQTLEAQVNTQMTRNLKLKTRLAEERRKNILIEESQELNLADRVELSRLAESVDFQSESDYRKKLDMLKEHYFGDDVVESSDDDFIENEQSQASTLNEEIVYPQQVTSSIDFYKKALSSKF